jgi:N-acetylneuraminic acid mutarotase
MSSSVHVHNGFGVFQNFTIESHCNHQVMDAQQKVITWTRPATFGAPPTPRGGHTSVLVGNLFVVFGGTRTDTEGTGKFKYLSDVFVLDTDTMRWHCPTLVGRSPPARYGHTAVVLDYKMYICGGRGEKGALFNDVWVLDVERWEWQLLPTSTAAPPAPRMGHSAVALAPHRILVFGGCEYALCCSSILPQGSYTS